MKRKRIKEIDLFLPNEEIEKLNDRYEFLYKRVKHATDLSLAQIDRECEILLLKYNFEIKELSALYEAEYWKRQAEIEAKNDEQIPWRRCWLWRIIFQPLTNRAQDIIEKEAELNAEEIFSPLEKELKNRESKLFGRRKKLSRRKRKKALRKYLKYKRLIEGDNSAASDNGPGDPDVKPLKEIIRQADETPHAEVFIQPEPKEVPEPPAPPIRKPRNNKQTGDNTP